MRVTKTYNGPEDETATGPNYPALVHDQRDRRARPDRHEPDRHRHSAEFDPVRLHRRHDAGVALRSRRRPPRRPGGTLSRNFGSVAGTRRHRRDDDVHTSTYRDSTPAPPRSCPAATGAFSTSTDSASASGSWAPVDPRDSTGGRFRGPATHTLDRQVDRGPEVRRPGRRHGPAGVSPGDTLQWTIAVQVSDFFALGSVMVDDLLGDGTRVDASFTPTLAVAGNGFNQARPE